MEFVDVLQNYLFLFLLCLFSSSVFAADLSKGTELLPPYKVTMV